MDEIIARGNVNLPCSFLRVTTLSRHTMARLGVRVRDVERKEKKNPNELNKKQNRRLKRVINGIESRKN